MHIYVFCSQIDKPTDQVSYILNAHWNGKSAQKNNQPSIKENTRGIYFLSQNKCPLVRIIFKINQLSILYSS